MPKDFLCPEIEDLQRFLLGEVSDQEIEELEQHLDGCPPCLETMHGLQVRDTLVEALQAQAAISPSLVDDQIDTMIRRLQGLPSFSEDSQTAADPSSPGVLPSGETPPDKLSPSSAVTEEGYGFLHPPQGPGELGRLGGYRVLSVLGTGGMGIVFKAEDLQLARQIALKVPRSVLHGSVTARKRFLREARAAAAVEHEHVIHI